MFPRIEPMPLAVLRDPFDHPDWIFELKYDGFRALAYLDGTSCSLVSRNGNHFRRFARLEAALAASIPGPAVLDGEIVCLDGDGAPLFYDLMRGRTPQYFAAFDLLWHDGLDLRELPILERKRRLSRLIPTPGAAFAVEHIAGDGHALFRSVCDRDLEGIVAKRADGLYTPDATTWVKIKNRRYSQWDGRRELFDRQRARRATA